MSTRGKGASGGRADGVRYGPRVPPFFWSPPTIQGSVSRDEVWRLLERLRYGMQWCSEQQLMKGRARKLLVSLTLAISPAGEVTASIGPAEPEAPEYHGCILSRFTGQRVTPPGAGARVATTYRFELHHEG